MTADLFVIIGTAIGLSMDALAVSVTNGFLIKELKLVHAFRMALFFGLFQAFMPLLGWLAGLTVRQYIYRFDHWIAAALLVFIGVKMIRESSCLEEAEAGKKKNCLHLPTLLLLSLATSLDALAVGISFAMVNVQIFLPVAVIGGITFINCFIGTQVGKKVGHFFENKLEIAGGIILIAIGLKITLEHLLKGI